MIPEVLTLSVSTVFQYGLVIAFFFLLNRRMKGRLREILEEIDVTQGIGLMQGLVAAWLLAFSVVPVMGHGVMWLEHLHFTLKAEMWFLVMGAIFATLLLISFYVVYLAFKVFVYFVDKFDKATSIPNRFVAHVSADLTLATFGFLFFFAFGASLLISIYAVDILRALVG